MVFRHCRGPFSNVPAGEIRPGVFLAPSRGCCDISVSIPSSPLTLSAVPTFLARCPNEICQILLSDSDPYSEIGRLLADYASNPIKLCSVSVTSLSPLINVYGDKNDYALRDLSRDGVDTVGVCGSNPHAPTNPFNQLRHTAKFSVAPNAPLSHRSSFPLSKRINRITGAQDVCALTWYKVE